MKKQERKKEKIHNNLKKMNNQKNLRENPNKVRFKLRKNKNSNNNL